VTKIPATTVALDVGGQPLWLLPERAAFLPESRTLLVADAHLGKAVSFRRLGVPVPAGTTEANLATLSALVERLGVGRVVFLGDFLHSARALAPRTLAAARRWRASHAALELTLVRGNHDARAGDPPAELGIEPCDEPLRRGGLLLCHHPRRLGDGYVLAGHLHPCLSLGGRVYERHRLACFWFDAALGVLPAFGAFTGMHAIRPRAGDRVYAVADGRVLEMPLRGPAATLPLPIADDAMPVP
jgi:DNA ligase-associated metallophosphoesterase